MFFEYVISIDYSKDYKIRTPKLMTKAVPQQ